ncbi:hypothetical protein SERLADRAFT_384337 [Serpula lacrymans var. lacrymans S7.9]|nr:uncharacterized protein SERLADRAFT_384337 [Serpula lacrymans var. lacrymans S7.9]EGO26102.1 hypothetical protein SERLADRAFT_384337 [Serpula lacrymans var. lacrymans S7.9]
MVEDRVEVLVDDKGERAELAAATRELRAVHPYEEIAYDVYRLEHRQTWRLRRSWFYRILL